jgi:hypothetical protein
MQNDLTESVQASIRPGEMVDVYYNGESNTAKQAYPSVVNTRFVQQFTQLGAGSSQFVISPNGGVSDIVMQFTTPASTGANYTLLALSSGWGYSLINRVSVRYGSSAQYFWNGAQMYLQNLLDCENSVKQDQINSLGGAALAGAACGNAVAYVYLKLPHNSPRAAGKPLPFPTDLLVQPIVVTVELFALNSIMTLQGGALSTAPTALASAQMQVKQEMLTDSSDQLARRVDMNSHAYTFPLPYFAQQVTQVQVTTSGSSLTNNVNLTGFRAGEVKQVILWLTTAAAANPGAGAYAPLNWQLMNNVTLTYNGEIFSRFDQGSSQLWNLVENEKISAVNIINQTVGSVAQAATVAYWTECSFAQVNKNVKRDNTLVHGKPILNAVVQLQFDAPALSTSYILNAMYIYNSSLLCSRGSAEYIF